MASFSMVQFKEPALEKPQGKKSQHKYLDDKGQVTVVFQKGINTHLLVTKQATQNQSKTKPNHPQLTIKLHICHES